MNLETQVCAIEHSKRLADIWVKQSSIYSWANHEGKFELTSTLMTELMAKRPLCIQRYASCDVYSAFTASELAELLPPQCSFSKYTGGRSGTMEVGYLVKYFDHDADGFICLDETLANAMAIMLIKLIEDGLHAIK